MSVRLTIVSWIDADRVLQTGSAGLVIPVLGYTIALLAIGNKLEV